MLCEILSLNGSQEKDPCLREAVFHCKGQTEFIQGLLSLVSTADTVTGTITAIRSSLRHLVLEQLDD